MSTAYEGRARSSSLGGRRTAGARWNGDLRAGRGVHTVRRVVEDGSAPVPAVGSAADTCTVFMLGYPATGKRTVGGELAGLVHGVLVDNASVNRPVLELLQWDGVRPLPPEV
jgi:hypothetical protein